MAKPRIPKFCEKCQSEYLARNLQQRYCGRSCWREAVRNPLRSITPWRLVEVKRDHPLALMSGNTGQLEHRVFLYNQIGPGPHPCYRCRRPLSWWPGSLTPLVVDHLDRDATNNELSNLAPCCTACNNMNTTRTIDVDDVVWRDENGDPHRGVVKPCGFCHEEFVTRLTWADPESRLGKYCSLSCSARAQTWGVIENEPPKRWVGGRWRVDRRAVVR